MKPTRALKIDAAKRTVTVVTVSSLNDMQEVVGGYICKAFSLPNGDFCYVDDDGLEKYEHFFRVPGTRLDHMYLAGNGIVLGKADHDGAETDAKTDPKKLEAFIQWAQAPFTDFPPTDIGGIVRELKQVCT